MSVTFTKTTTLETVECCNCGVLFALPQQMNRKLQSDPTQDFYCPNGHAQRYSWSADQKARREAENKLREKENELANIAAAKVQLENKLAKTDKELKRLKNGVCPCCNRSFHNLQQHIKKQHPEILKP